MKFNTDSSHDTLAPHLTNTTVKGAYFSPASGLPIRCRSTWTVQVRTACSVEFCSACAFVISLCVALLRRVAERNVSNVRSFVSYGPFAYANAAETRSRSIRCLKVILPRGLLSTNISKRTPRLLSGRAPELCQ